MTPDDFAERVAQILHERRRGFYVDALELEVALWRDLAANATDPYFLAAHRELA